MTRYGVILLSEFGDEEPVPLPVFAPERFFTWLPIKKKDAASRNN
jgi:hypothetical protein